MGAIGGSIRDNGGPQFGMAEPRQTAVEQVAHAQGSAGVDPSGILDRPLATGFSATAATSRQARRLIASANELLAIAAELEGLSRPGTTVSPAGADDAHGDALSPTVPATGTDALTSLPGSGFRATGPFPTNQGADAAALNPATAHDDMRWLRWARRTYRNRRSRAAIFEDESLFGEPAWDLLLDLFIAAKERKRVPVTSACIGASVPTTTALRWLAVLEERGLVLREADPSDARRIFVRLSADAYARMVAYFARASSGDAEDMIEAARAGSRAVSGRAAG